MPSSLGETTSVYVPLQRNHTDSAGGEKAGSGLWDKDGFNFSDLLDVINPLQHIPIVSNLYRNITGDDIGQVPRVIGGALFGGAIGFVASLLNAIVDEETGKDVGEHAIAMLFGDSEPDSAPDGSPKSTIVATASAFSSANDAIFYNDQAPATLTPDTPPIMLAAAATAENNSDFAGVEDPVAAPPAPRPVPNTELAHPAVSAAILAKAPAAIRPTMPPAAAIPTAAIPVSATPVRPRPAAPAIPATTPAPGETGDEPDQVKMEQHARAALLSHFGGGEKTAGEALSQPGPWVSQAMMYGLDRYEAMAKERNLVKPDLDKIF